MKTTNIKTNPHSYCRRCRFYHGQDELVCAVHPYGPVKDTCSDFVPKLSSPSFRNWHVWIKMLIISLLLFFVGYSFALWRMRNYQPNIPTHKAELLVDRNASKPFGTNNFDPLNQDH